MTTKNFLQSVKSLDLAKTNVPQEVPGILGFMLNGTQTVEVPTREGFVYVRLRNTTNELIQAFNEEVSPVYGLPVIVTRDEVNRGQYVIKGRDLGVYMGAGVSGWSTSSYLPRHGATHSFHPATPGGDLTWIYGKQFMPLNVYPSGSSAAPNVIIDPSAYYQENQWRYAGGTGTADLVPTYLPTGTLARMVLVYLDDDGNPQLEPGTTYFDPSITGASVIIPYLPALPDTGAIPLGGVRIVTGTTTIGWANLYDLRPLIVSDGFIPTGSNAPYDAPYVTIGNTGDLTAERALTAGTNINIVDGGANSTVTINSTASGGGDLLIYDDEVFKVTGTALDFVEDLQVEVTGSVAYVSVPTGTFERAGHVHPSDNWYLTIYEDGVFKATGTVIDFQDNLNVVASGTSVFVDCVSSGGGGGDLLIYDDSVFRVTGSAISFDDNLDVAVTGSVAYVTAEGVTGTAGAAGAAGPPGDNTQLIYDDSVFKITGTAISFDEDLDVSVTGSIAYVNAMVSSPMEGRLTLESGVPISTSDVTGTSLYYAPYIGNALTLFDSSGNKKIQFFTEFNVSLASTTGTAGYDAFAYDNAGTHAIELVGWTSPTVRATAITRYKGVYVKSGDITRTYLGSFYCETAGYVQDIQTKRFLWNYHNQKSKQLYVKETTDTWSYGTATWRQANNSSSNKIEFIVGVLEDVISADVLASIFVNDTGDAGAVGIGLDSTSVNSALLFAEAALGGVGTVDIRLQLHAKYKDYPGIGYHYLAWLEIARAGTVTFEGDLGVTSVQSGLLATIMC